jgi:hypothetical protein
MTMALGYRILANQKWWPLLWLLALGSAQAQVDSLGGITRQFSRFQRAHLPEKLFLHLDRPTYSSGETLWLKAYAVDGTYGQPLALSTVAYVEVLDAANHPVLQSKVALRQGTGAGSLDLPARLPSGAYTVRAYTNWMKNAGPEYFFHCPITVLNGFTASASAAATDSVAYDVQFFPEGGHLVQGLRSKVAFKVCDQHGRGIATHGQLLNQQGQRVGSFATAHAGMGHFMLTPEPGAAYTAVLSLPGGRSRRVLLPLAAPQGYALRLEDSTLDELTLAIETAGVQITSVALLGHMHQQVAVARQQPLQDGRTTFRVAKAALQPGITHFTVFDDQQRPVAERLYFKPPTATRFVQLHTDKPQYGSREKVTVELKPTASDTTRLSMSVYRLDSLTSPANVDIAAYMALSSDLKGLIEQPTYYLSPGPEAAAAADNLMLTQGWSRFSWPEVFAASPALHLPETHGPIIQARLSQAGTGQARPGLTAYLAAPSRHARLSNTRSNSAGLVQFEIPDWVGPQLLTLQTDLQQDSTSQFTLLDPFWPLYATRPYPAFDLVPRWQAEYARRHLQTQAQQEYYGPYRPQNIARADSLPFYGRPNETYLLDKYTRFKVLEEVLREYVPGVLVHTRKDGFHLAVVDKLNKTILSDHPLILLDGVPVFNTNKIMAMNPLKIKRLEVLTSRYFHGLSMYQGVISFSTYKGDLEGFELDGRALMQQYEGLQVPREFYAPRYETAADRQRRLPDLRNLLYWNPDITLAGVEKRSLDFYTGDQRGWYLVVLQGLSTTGTATSNTVTFEVKPVL